MELFRPIVHTLCSMGNVTGRYAFKNINEIYLIYIAKDGTRKVNTYNVASAIKNITGTSYVRRRSGGAISL